MAYRKSLLILAFVALASWWAPEADAYQFCEHTKNDGTKGKHCTPCGHTGQDVLKSALGSVCLLAGANAFTGLSHVLPKTEYFCTAAEGSGAIVDDPLEKTVSWDYGITDPTNLVTCTEFVDGVATDSGLFIMSGTATGLTTSCAAVNDPVIKSRRTYTGSCDKKQTVAVSQTITFAETGHRPSWCPGGSTGTDPCQLDVVSPGLPINASSNTTEKLCADAFPLEAAGTPGRLGSKQILLYSVGFGSPGCSGNAAGERHRARGCTTQSWDPANPVSATECVLQISGTIFRHVKGDSGTGGNECGPGSGVVQESFKLQNCTTNGVVKYRCFSEPETAEVDPGFDARTVDPSKATTTLNGVTAKRNGTFVDTDGDTFFDMIEFSFPQCEVAQHTTVANGEASFLFKAKTQQDGFAIDTDTVSVAGN